jgi:hypothetical protein
VKLTIPYRGSECAATGKSASELDPNYGAAKSWMMVQLRTSYRKNHTPLMHRSAREVQISKGIRPDLRRA